MTTATQGGEDGSDTESGCCTGTCHIVRVGGVRQGLCACCGSRLGCRRACCLCGSQVLRRVGVARGTLRLLRVVDLLHGIVDCLQGIVVSLCLLEVIGGLLLVFGSGVVGVLGILDLCEVFLAGIGGVLNLLELVLPIGEVGICDVGIEACRICEDLVCMSFSATFARRSASALAAAAASAFARVSALASSSALLASSALARASWAAFSASALLWLAAVSSASF